MERLHRIFDALDRALDALIAALLAFLGTMLSLGFPADPALAMAGATSTPGTLGRPQDRAYRDRRLARLGDQRSRAPDSVAFVTA